MFLAAAAVFWRYVDATSPEAAFRPIILLTGAALAIIPAMLPMQPRTFGQIPPNVLGHTGLVLLVLAQPFGWRFRIILSAAALGLIGYAQARTVLGAAMIFLAIYWIVAPQLKSANSLIVAAIVGALVLLGGLAAGPLLVKRTSAGLSQAMRVQSSLRGADSGFTGRAQLWSNGFDLLHGSETVGYGFRTRSVQGDATDVARVGAALNSHSGALNALLDMGVLGGLVYTIAYLGTAVTCLMRWAFQRDVTDRLAGSLILGWVPALFVEPNYLNFAAPSAALVTICFARAVVSPQSNVSRPIFHYSNGRSTNVRRLTHTAIRLRS